MNDETLDFGSPEEQAYEALKQVSSSVPNLSETEKTNVLNIEPATLDQATSTIDHDESNIEAVLTDSSFEQQNIADALSGFWRSPIRTIDALWEIAREPKQKTPKPVFAYPTSTSKSLPPRRAISQHLPPSYQTAKQVNDDALSRPLELIILAMRAGAFVVAWIGCYLMATEPARLQPDGVNVGILPLLFGISLWFISELTYFFLPEEYGPVKLFQSTVPKSPGSTHSYHWMEIAQRVVFLIGAAVLAFVSLMTNTNNLFTVGGMIAWGFSILLTALALTPLGWSARNWVADIGRNLRPRWSWTVLIVIVLMLIGGYFRLTNLHEAPSQMTSDHVEMLRDVLLIPEGYANIFFANNDGREALQFYVFALFAQLPAQGINFDSLKLLTAIQGIITIPIMFFMAREVIGREQKQLATIVGLTTAALIAVSYWNVVLSRIGERMILMPLFTTIFILFFARALRYNQRMDFLYAGIAIGFGLYTYQAFRMIPLVVAAGGVIALLFSIRSGITRSIVLNFIAMGILAFVIYLPLFGYSLQDSSHYWRRTTGRLFGDETASLQERFQAFNDNVPILMSNMRNALLMYNWKGDAAWFHNAWSQPAFDPVSGGLLVVGVAAWAGRMLRKRDAMTWLLPIFLFLMLLPSALSIAYPVENPSATRTGGSMPLVYLLAGLALALLLRGLARVVGGKAGWIIALLTGAALVAGSYLANYSRYFDLYAPLYSDSTLPYNDAGEVLRDFAENVGGWGNAFIINYPFWWDHRAVAFAANMPKFPNGIASLDETPAWLANAPNQEPPFALDINRDMLFFYSSDDQLTQDWLQMVFPSGAWIEMSTSHPEHFYRIFRVPALGEEGFQNFLDMTLQPSGE